jgi:hypothetical protein
MSVPDPNWFYSAIAQSAAAIVGVICAFVASWVMMLTSERSQIGKRINEIDTEIKELKRQNVPLLEYIEEVDRKDDEESVDNFLMAKNDNYIDCHKIIGKNNKEISYKKAKIQELKHQLNQIVLPEHFKGLIFYLIYFTIVVVILPLWLLPITSEQHLFWKPIVLGLFITGLFSAFLYIFIKIRLAR